MCKENTAPEEMDIATADNNDVSRYKVREQAFLLGFESLFSDTDIDEIADNAGDARDDMLSGDAISRAKGVRNKIMEVDKKISENLKPGWKISRISKVSLSILRLALYEMMYDDSIPVSVSINEAVELTKKYSVEDEAAFVNGVLGSVAKTL
nr:transcription antitermination factor NusB [uncultured Ruminococcus sp.]